MYSTFINLSSVAVLLCLCIDFLEGLGATSCAFRVFDEIPHFQAAGDRQATCSLVYPPCKTYSIRSHGLFLFFVELKTHCRTGGHVVL